jgi:hypothetical protein
MPPGSQGTLPQLATQALPRLAAVTALVVIAATWVVVAQRDQAETTTATTLESVILGDGGDSTGDVVFDALLHVERNDG